MKMLMNMMMMLTIMLIMMMMMLTMMLLLQVMTNSARGMQIFATMEKGILVPDVSLMMMKKNFMMVMAMIVFSTAA